MCKNVKFIWLSTRLCNKRQFKIYFTKPKFQKKTYLVKQKFIKRKNTKFNLKLRLAKIQDLKFVFNL